MFIHRMMKWYNFAGLFVGEHVINHCQIGMGNLCKRTYICLKWYAM